MYAKVDETRLLAITAAASMKPIPQDENNPLADRASHDDIFLWAAYKEAKALIKFEAALAPAAPDGKK